MLKLYKILWQIRKKPILLEKLNITNQELNNLMKQINNYGKRFI